MFALRAATRFPIPPTCRALSTRLNAQTLARVSESPTTTRVRQSVHRVISRIATSTADIHDARERGSAPHADEIFDYERSKIHGHTVESFTGRGICREVSLLLGLELDACHIDTQYHYADLKGGGAHAYLKFFDRESRTWKLCCPTWRQFPAHFSNKAFQDHIFNLPLALVHDPGSLLDFHHQMQLDAATLMPNGVPNSTDIDILSKYPHDAPFVSLKGSFLMCPDKLKACLRGLNDRYSTDHLAFLMNSP